MGRSVFAALLIAVAAPAMAASPFDGTWKADLKAATYDSKPDKFLLAGGTYSCSTCTPPLTLRADGKIHATPDRDYADAMAVTVVDASTVRTASYKGGKVYAETTRALSADGNMVTINWRNSLNAKGEWQSGVAQARRVEPAPAGAHAISGGWVPVTTDQTQVPDANLTVTLKLDGDTVSSRSGQGESYTAMFGGPAVAVVGDPVGSKVQLRRISDTSFEETTILNGKPTEVITYTLTAPDTVTLTTKDLRGGFTDTFVARRQ